LLTFCDAGTDDSDEAERSRYVEIVFALLWGSVIFGEGLPWQSVAGGTLVMGCALTTLWKRKRAADT
jgi:drug/metabolite transporter (DMT)-like permease